jgi:hypothetical protein
MWRVRVLDHFWTLNVTCSDTWPFLNTKCNVFVYLTTSEHEMWRVRVLDHFWTLNVTCSDTWPLLNTKCNVFVYLTTSEHQMWRVRVLDHFWTLNVTCSGTWPLLNTKCDVFVYLTTSEHQMWRVRVLDHFWTPNVTCSCIWPLLNTKCNVYGYCRRRSNCYFVLFTTSLVVSTIVYIVRSSLPCWFLVLVGPLIDGFLVAALICFFDLLFSSASLILFFWSAPLICVVFIPYRPEVGCWRPG